MILGYDSLRPRPRPQLGRGRGLGLGLGPALLAACCLLWQTMNGRPCGRSIVCLCVAALHSAPFGWLVATRVADGLHGLMDLTCTWRDLGPLLLPQPHRTAPRNASGTLPWCIVSLYVSPPQHNTTLHHTSDYAPQHKPTTPLLQAHHCHSSKHSSTTLGHADDAGHVVNSHLL